jgi:hypothetical protein
MIMADREPPVISEHTPIGPDVDLDHEDVRLPGGVRLTSTRADAIVQEVHHAAGETEHKDQVFWTWYLVRVRGAMAGILRRMADAVEPGHTHQPH